MTTRVWALAVAIITALVALVALDWHRFYGGQP